MTVRSRTTKAWTSIAAVSLVFAGCGNGSNDSNAATSDVPVSVGAPIRTGDAAGADDMASGPFGPACDLVPGDGAGSFAGMAGNTAASAASSNPQLSTLVTAVAMAGLSGTLNSDGPFTIFAPTNDAFSAVPASQLDDVLADVGLLSSVLRGHVIVGESLDAAQLGAAGTEVTMNGTELEFSADGTKVNGVDVLCSDVVTANATIHIIASVLMPPVDNAGSTTDDHE